jgi:hypothetical protein
MPLNLPRLAAIRRFAAVLGLAALPLLAVPALADDDWDDQDCKIAAGAARIDSNRAIEIAESLGYQIAEYEIDDGCIELNGSDAHGAQVKLRLDPVSGDVIPYRR